MKKKTKRFVRPTVSIMAMESDPLMLEASVNGTVSGKVGAKHTVIVKAGSII